MDIEENDSEQNHADKPVLLLFEGANGLESRRSSPGVCVPNAKANILMVNNEIKIIKNL